MRKLDTVAAEDVTTDELDDLITIEAPTVEEAMAQLAAELGEDARIVSAEKVARGGIGGFFAKEIVQLTARRPEHDRSGLPGVLGRLTDDASSKEQAFGDVLRKQLTDRKLSEGLDDLLNAAGWTDSTSAADTAADDTATHREGDPMTDTAEPPRAPVTVGPMVTAAPVPRPSTTMPNATISERMAAEHLVAEPPFEALQSSITVPGLAAAVEAIQLPERANRAGQPQVESPATNGTVTSDAGPALPPTPTATPETHATIAEHQILETTDAPAGLGSPSWNVTELVRHGLPEAVISAVRGLDPTDDLAWITAVAEAVAPWCGPLPAGHEVIAGAGADRLADALDRPLVRLGDVAPYDGSFCSGLAGAPDDRAWLEFVLGGRHLHFVLGEDELWRDLLVTDPAVVSWVSPTGLVDALYLASTLGSTLGFGTLDESEPMLRAQPADIAFALRRIIGRN